MLYLRSATLPDGETEFLRVASDPKKGAMTCYGSRYPFGLFPERGLDELAFSPVTIFAGGNGSGKSTLLNVLADRLGLGRETPFSRTAFFDDYAALVRVTLEGELPGASRIITSDDVFRALLGERGARARIEAEREALIGEYWEMRGGRKTVRLRSPDDLDELKRYNAALRGTPSRFVNERLSRAEDGVSNGERALRYFTEAIGTGALYLLDEPENSLSAVYQARLAAFLAESARFFDCQFVIATHSPLLLALPGARLYDLDARPVREVRWTELENVRVLHDFFAQREDEFR